MESKYWKMQLDDIIFESRNKSYGAYALRQSYGKRMKRGVIGGLAVFALLISSPLIATRLTPTKVDLDVTPIDMTDIVPDKPKDDLVPPPPPPPPPPPKQIATVRFVPPIVTLEAETEPPMPNPADITVNVANQTQEGENREAFVPAVVTPVAPPPDEPVVAKPVEDKTVHLIVEQVPEFPDGTKAMFKWLSDNVKYPPIARENGIEGTVYVGFVVGKDGSIQNVQIKRGISGGCNEEAVRVVQAMPAWKPGRQNGKAVNVAFTLPIKFKLEN
jgi:protein TonB